MEDHSNKQNISFGFIYEDSVDIYKFMITSKSYGIRPVLHFPLKNYKNDFYIGLGITKNNSGINLLDDEIYLADDGFIFDDKLIGISKRIGIDGSGDAAMLPYRFYVKENHFVSSYPNK